MGNLEASISVLLAYQEGGLPAATRQAVLELVMNAPGADWATACSLIAFRISQGICDKDSSRRF